MDNTVKPPRNAAAESPAAPPVTFWQLFTPKLVTVLREGYRPQDFRADLISGLTVAIVALPLSMAIAIASGTPPERGLFTAVVGGFLICLLSGSRFQIGGPAAAFTVIVATSVATHGLDGMLLATLMAGVFLVAMGLFRLGSYVKFIPYPVTVGFISGIALIVFASQLHDLLGLKLSGAEPPDLLPKLEALWSAIGTVQPAAVALSVFTIAIIVGMRRLLPKWPGILAAVVLSALAVRFIHLPVETIDTRFGGIPSALLPPALPSLSLAKIRDVIPDAVTFALLGAIESLLSATVADSMTGRRHRSNMELIAQGVGNIGSALFGGIPATGTIARTATNIRAGAKSPISGMLHALFVLLFMVAAAPLAGFVPLSSLAGVLVVVAWNMAEKREFVTLIRASRSDTLVLLTTFALTVFANLAIGILVGFALSSLLLIHRLSQTTKVAQYVPQLSEDVADGEEHPIDDPANSHDANIAVYRINGAFFFAAAGAISSVLDGVDRRYRAVIIDFANVPLIDSTAANAIASLVRQAAQRGVTIVLSSCSPAIQAILVAHGMSPPRVQFEPSLPSARQAARRELASANPAS